MESQQMSAPEHAISATPLSALREKNDGLRAAVIYGVQVQEARVRATVQKDEDSAWSQFMNSVQQIRLTHLAPPILEAEREWRSLLTASEKDLFLLLKELQVSSLQRLQRLELSRGETWKRLTVVQYEQEAMKALLHDYVQLLMDLGVAARTEIEAAEASAWYWITAEASISLHGLLMRGEVEAEELKHRMALIDNFRLMKNVIELREEGIDIEATPLATPLDTAEPQVTQNDTEETTTTSDPAPAVHTDSDTPELSLVAGAGDGDGEGQGQCNESWGSAAEVGPQGEFWVG